MRLALKYFSCLALISTPTVGIASTAGQKIAVSSSEVSTVQQLPVCSKTVKTNCKKRGANKTWIVVGAALAAAVGVALASDGDSVSP